ncbi:MAG: hypothetical protein PHD55_12000 [Methanoregula sp.]|nr:hypothetical protein [Methanoregula sp.]
MDPGRGIQPVLLHAGRAGPTAATLCLIASRAPGRSLPALDQLDIMHKTVPVIVRVLMQDQGRGPAAA